MTAGVVAAVVSIRSTGQTTWLAVGRITGLIIRRRIEILEAQRSIAARAG